MAAGVGGSGGAEMLESGGGGAVGAQAEDVSGDADAAKMAKKLGVSLEKLDAEGLVIMTNRGYIKRIDPSGFKTQNRATRGRNSGKMRGGDEAGGLLRSYASWL